MSNTTASNAAQIQSTLSNEPCLGAVSKVNSQFSTYYEENFNVDGSPKSVELEAIFNAPQDHISDIVGYSKYCYRKYGIIMRVINIIRDFGACDYDLQYPKRNERLKDCIKKYVKRIGLESLLKDMIQEISTTGNLVCYDRDGQCVDIYPINQIEVIPLKKNGKQVLGFKTSELQNMFNSYDKEINDMISTAYPNEVIDGYKKSKIYTILNPDKSFFAKINSSRYERYGVPVILPAFEDLAHKNLLKEAEKATANDIIDKIMCIQVGDADNKPTDGLIAQYSSLFDGVNGSVRVTVPYYVDMKWIEPESDIFGQDKFVQVDTDILNTLGISLSLIRGEGGGNYAEGMISFTGLTRTIETIRNSIEDIVNNLFKNELKRNGFREDDAPVIKFHDVVIDKEAKMSLVKDLFTTAGLPYEVLYKECGYDFDYIKVIREEENNQNIENIFKLREQPFQGNTFNNNDGNSKPNISSSRKSDPNQSNNQTPRAGIKNRGE